MQTEETIPNNQQLALAYVVDAHNVGCLVRLAGVQSTQQAQYSPAIQQNGVVIRTCHLVLVDQRATPLEVVWRIGTVGTIKAILEGKLTVNLGHRQLTIPLRDERPSAEQSESPLSVGNRVFLRGSPLEQAEVVDVFRDGELSHPERLQASVEKIIKRRQQATA